MAWFKFPGSRPKTLGVTGGKLRPCPEAGGGCVCSQYRQSETFMGKDYVQPLPYAGEPGDAMTRVIAVLMQQPSCTLVTNTPHYIHAEFESPSFGFVDDVEFLLSPTERVIHVRSAARYGFTDFGTNRDRVRQLREAFDEADE